jgi:CheY-like chemotaxis protein
MPRSKSRGKVADVDLSRTENAPAPTAPSVLLVDDVARCAVDVRNGLDGIPVLACQNPAEADAVLSGDEAACRRVGMTEPGRPNVQVALVDLYLGEGPNGLETLRMLTQNHPRVVPVLYTTELESFRKIYALAAAEIAGERGVYLADKNIEMFSEIRTLLENVASGFRPGHDKDIGRLRLLKPLMVVGLSRDPKSFLEVLFTPEWRYPYFEALIAPKSQKEARKAAGLSPRTDTEGDIFRMLVAQSRRDVDWLELNGVLDIRESERLAGEPDTGRDARYATVLAFVQQNYPFFHAPRVAAVIRKHLEQPERREGGHLGRQAPGNQANIARSS